MQLLFTNYIDWGKTAIQLYMTLWEIVIPPLLNHEFTSPDYYQTFWIKKSLKQNLSDKVKKAKRS